MSVKVALPGGSVRVTVDDARSITSATINGAGHLIITYSDGEQQDAGSVVSTASQYVVRTAGEVIGGHRAVAVRADNKAWIAEPSDSDAESTIGITVGAAMSGANVSVQVGGEMIEPSWAWSQGPVWMGASGVLTQTVPTSGVLFRLGQATGPQAMVIEPQLVARI